MLQLVTPKRRTGRRPSGQEGQALVELAIVLVPLCLLIVAIIQFGFWFQARSALRDGVRAAARQASLCRSINNFTDANAYTVYHGIVNTSVNNPLDPTIKWNGADPVNCTVGTSVTVQGSYNYPINILGVFQVAGTNLTATATSVVE
jgi:Flp pilus assembly protein TadG